MSKARRKSLNETDLDREKYLSAAIHINSLKKDDPLARSKPKQFTQSKRILPPKKPPPITFETRAVSSVQQQLDDVGRELNIGNVQLEQIKQLVNSKKGPKKVVVPRPSRRKDYSEVAMEKRKFLLTLNDVQERMQQIQHKFFNGHNLRYKSVKNFYDKKKNSEVVDQDTTSSLEVNEDATNNERQILSMARDALARRKAMLECDSGARLPEDPSSKHTAFRTSLMKSEYLKKEFQKQTKTSEVNVSVDENFLGKLENSFANRPFGKAQPGKSYWSALKGTLKAGERGIGKDKMEEALKKEKLEERTEHGGEVGYKLERNIEEIRKIWKFMGTEDQITKTGERGIGKDKMEEAVKKEKLEEPTEHGGDVGHKLERNIEEIRKVWKFMGTEKIGHEDASTWLNVARKIGVMGPHFWPRKSARLQAQAVACLIIVVLGRINNLYVPIVNKLVVDSMGTSVFRADLIFAYLVLKALQGGGTDGMGVLNNIRAMLWVRVQQHTTRNIRVELLRHLHKLSLRWHLQRKTGEVLRLMDRGTDSIKDLVECVVFTIAPTVVDVFVAIGYFVVSFDLWFGVIITFTMLMYLATTVAITEYRTKHKRRMNLSDNETRAQSVDSLLNFETVKYFGAEDFEVKAYDDVVLKYQRYEYKVNVTLNGLKTVQNLIVSVGLLIGSLLCAYLVVEKKNLTVGDYVLFSTYMLQLCVPLNSFGKHYVVIQNAFVDMENMLDLMHVKEEVVNKPDAKALRIAEGTVAFENVSFVHDNQIILKNVSFVVPTSKTLALVGPSGGGKSTIVRLLFRLYDVTRGRITIDDQNIGDVTCESLRKHIGVVPQDTVLFNNTIKYNIRYGRLDADHLEVIEAARQAHIHERVVKMPNGYDTKVGERGLMLSGGEKQRVAIARTLLKAPAIAILDEATSALDVNTERQVQNALRRACVNRTTIIIAHRLSTVIHADEILVLKNGEIVERGTHDSLTKANGLYSSMWHEQMTEDFKMEKSSS
ncbi:hypothetical protein FQR65_LT14203 [Abscondita terminalis]|nr:hypothetical protein FQR65_LT14203 [Abscondita terminalis]